MANNPLDNESKNSLEVENQTIHGGNQQFADNISNINIIITKAMTESHPDPVKAPIEENVNPSPIAIPEFVEDIVILGADDFGTHCLKVPTTDMYSSYQPIPQTQKNRFLRLKISTTSGWIEEEQKTSEHEIIENKTYTSHLDITYQQVKNYIYIIKDPIRPFETQIGTSRSQRPGGNPGMIVMDKNTTLDTFRTMYPHVLLSDEHKNWLATVLAEIITDADILDYMYHHPKTDSSVKKQISKNPFAPKGIQKQECLFCDTDFRDGRAEIADQKHGIYIICNDYPYAPYFHYVAILKDPIHSWTELKEHHLQGMNQCIHDFLNIPDRLNNSPGIEIGLNSSIRHLVLGKTTHSSAGASIAHVHKQICGIAPTTETLGDYLSKLCDVYSDKGQGLDYLHSYLDLLRKSGFIIWEDAYVALYVPFGQIAMDELQIMVKSRNEYLKLTSEEISSLSKAEFLVTRLFFKWEINSFNEIMISKRFNSAIGKDARLIFTFITREIDLAISELSLVYIVDSHPEKTVQKVKLVWDAVKKECGRWIHKD